MAVRSLILLLALTAAFPQTSGKPGLEPAAKPAPPMFVCPMDPEVRSPQPGKCPRCGMTLVAGIPRPVEYPMDFRAAPRQIPAGREVTLQFRVLDPKSGEPVKRFQIVHEKLFHLFLVSQDLEYFAHEHPVFQPDGWFLFKTKLPKAGTYRLLADFDPIGGTPQLAVKTFVLFSVILVLAFSMACGYTK